MLNTLSRLPRTVAGWDDVPAAVASDADALVRMPAAFVAEVLGESKLAKYGEGILKVLGAAED